MKKYMFPLLVIVLFVFGLFSVFNFLRPKTPAVQPAKSAAPKVASSKPLPRVVTLYQKGEGESDLAFFVSRELAAKNVVLANFSAVNVLDDPQLVEYYGVETTPALIFLLPSGKLYKKHEGYLDKQRIMAIVATIPN